MKMTIQRTASLDLDISEERKRIDKCFKGRSDNSLNNNLHHLMDLIEKQEWNKAKEEIEGEWWCGYDTDRECPRLEYIGMVKPNSRFFDPWLTYIDVVYMMADNPENHKVIS
jgi:hypothetical protein